MASLNGVRYCEKAEEIREMADSELPRGAAKRMSRRDLLTLHVRNCQECDEGAAPAILKGEKEAVAAE